MSVLFLKAEITWKISDIEKGVLLHYSNPSKGIDNLSFSFMVSSFI